MLLASLLFRLHSSFPHAFVSALLLNAAHCPRCTRDSFHSLLPAGLLSLAQGLVPFLIHHEALDPGRGGPCRFRHDICTHLQPPRPAPSLLTESNRFQHNLVRSKPALCARSRAMLSSCLDDTAIMQQCKPQTTTRARTTLLIPPTVLLSLPRPRKTSRPSPSPSTRRQPRLCMSP